jgi:tRNA(Ile)-lysidine synthase
LRGRESIEDENFVKELAEKLDFELVLGTPNEESKIEDQKGNLEENARRARYQFLNETAQNLNAEGILTAHTLNDQAETFLLNLIRGSGLEGLGGMKPIRNENSDAVSEIENIKSEIRLIRPLLTWAKREDTENFCLLNEIEFRYDSMNEDLAFRRVRIRKVLLPLLKDFNPKIVETLGKTAELLRENAESLNRFAKINAAENKIENEIEASSSKDVKINEEESETTNALNVKDLKDVFPSMRRSILREWLKTSRGDLRRLGAKHIESIENLILSRKSGNKIELPGNESVVKKDGKLFYKKTTVEKC